MKRGIISFVTLILLSGCSGQNELSITSINGEAGIENEEVEMDSLELFIDEANLETIVSELQHELVRSMTVSPNQEMVAFGIGEKQINDQGQPYIENLGLSYIWSVGNPIPTQLDIGSQFIGDIIWSPDSQALLIDTGTSMVREGYIIRTSDLSVIASKIEYTRDPIFSPDSRFISISLKNNTPYKYRNETELENTFDLAMYDLEKQQLITLIEADDEHILYPKEWKDEYSIIYIKRNARTRVEEEHTIKLENPL